MNTVRLFLIMWTNTDNGKPNISKTQAHWKNMSLPTYLQNNSLQCPAEINPIVKHIMITEADYQLIKIIVWFLALNYFITSKNFYYSALSVNYIYAFSRRFYPKRLTVHSGYTLFCQYACSLGIEPTTFALLTQCSTTEPQEHVENLWKKCKLMHVCIT